MLILTLAVLGLSGIVGGVVAWRYCARVGDSPTAPRLWRSIRVVGFVAGGVLVVVTFFGSYALGYPYDTPKGEGRVVGIPFIVAFFDHRGHDYSGPFTLLGAFGNAVFWFLFPQLVLAGYAWWRKKHELDGSAGV